MHAATSAGEDTPPAAPAATAWPQPIGAVEILPADAARTMPQAWRDARHDGIGGSDIAVVLGLVSWESVYGLWLTKTGQRPPVTETPIMTRGKYAELMLAQWYADQTGIALRKTGTWVVDGSEWMRCNPDRFTSDGGGAEMKAPDTDDWGQMWRHGPAAHAVAQALWCMAVTGLPHWYVIADGGKAGLRWWRVDYDERRITRMVQFAEDWWWRHVVEGYPPEVDGSQATADACKAASLPKEQLARYAELPGCTAWARERAKLKASIAELKDKLDVIENRFRAGLTKARIATDGGVPVLEWAPYGDQGHRRFGEPKTATRGKRK